MYYKVDPTKPNLTPILALTESDGTGVRLEDDGFKWDSLNPHSGGGFHYSDSVQEVSFSGLGKELSFPDWLRNHDVTADNFKALSVERQAELLLAFFNGETFSNHNLLTGEIATGEIRLLWDPSGRAFYELPFHNPLDITTIAWWQQQTAAGGIPQHGWYAQPPASP